MDLFFPSRYHIKKLKNVCFISIFYKRIKLKYTKSFKLTLTTCINAVDDVINVIIILVK